MGGRWRANLDQVRFFGRQHGLGIGVTPGDAVSIAECVESPGVWIDCGDQLHPFCVAGDRFLMRAGNAACANDCTSIVVHVCPLSLWWIKNGEYERKCSSYSP